LHDALEFARSGDTLIVWKLDRLARSLKQLIETVETLRLRDRLRTHSTAGSGVIQAWDVDPSDAWPDGRI